MRTISRRMSKMHVEEGAESIHKKDNKSFPVWGTEFQVPV